MKRDVPIFNVDLPAAGAARAKMRICRENRNKFPENDAASLAAAASYERGPHDVEVRRSSEPRSMSTLLLASGGCRETSSKSA